MSDRQKWFLTIWTYMAINTFVGELVSHITTSTNTMSEILSQELSYLMWYISRFSFLLFFMITQSWKMLLLTWMGLPICWVITKFTGTIEEVELFHTFLYIAHGTDSDVIWYLVVTSEMLIVIPTLCFRVFPESSRTRWPKPTRWLQRLSLTSRRWRVSPMRTARQRSTDAAWITSTGLIKCSRGPTPSACGPAPWVCKPFFYTVDGNYKHVVHVILTLQPGYCDVPRIIYATTHKRIVSTLTDWVGFDVAFSSWVTICALSSSSCPLWPWRFVFCTMEAFWSPEGVLAAETWCLSFSMSSSLLLLSRWGTKTLRE